MKIVFFTMLSFFFQYGQSQIESNPDSYRDKEVKDTTKVESLSEDEKLKKEAHDKLEGYRQRVLKGESMSVLAALYTDDPGSAKTGGCYREIGRGVFVPEFEEVAFKLKPGEVSEVFETQYGFHFIQLIERRGDVVDLRHILVKTK